MKMATEWASPVIVVQLHDVFHVQIYTVFHKKGPPIVFLIFHLNDDQFTQNFYQL